MQRLSASRKGVRMAGIDIGVHRSDRRSRVGKLNRQGSPQLRWALYEAALAACRPSSPDHADYLALKARGLSHTRASLTIARKLARRCFHALREFGLAALEPVADPLITVPSRSARPLLVDDLNASGQLPQLARLPPHGRRPTKDRAAGVIPPGLIHQPSRHRPEPGRGPR